MGPDGLVGRDGEIGRLVGLLDDLTAGRGRAAWVEGEPGIGKSALLRAGLSGAQQLGCQVFWGAADELGQRFPLQVLLDGLAVVPGSADPMRREVVELLHGGEFRAGTAPTDPVPGVTERLLALMDRLSASAPPVL